MVLITIFNYYFKFALQTGLYFQPRRALDIYKSTLNTTHNFDTR